MLSTMVLVAASLDHILTVVFRRMNSHTAERLRSTSIVGDIRFPDGCKDAPSICGRMGEGRISMYGADAEKIQLWMVGSEKDGEGVLYGRLASSGGNMRRSRQTSWPV